MLSCFKAYDIRGVLGEEISKDLFYRIGRAFPLVFSAKKVSVGHDARETSPTLKDALANGLMESGCDVIDIGLAGTEEIYFSAFHLELDGGLEVTASHNPIDHNGLKLVGKNATPISNENGLLEIARLVEANRFPEISSPGSYIQDSFLQNYIEHLLGYIDCGKIKAMRIVTNAGNGTAGHVVDALEIAFNTLSVPVEIIKFNNEPDSTFPKGIPNPLIPENRTETCNAVLEHKADIGIAWDGDFDRCFLFDEKGNFIEGYYVVGLLAKAFLAKNPGERIIHDPRLTWNTIDLVNAAGGRPVQSKTGHSFIKQSMRKENAIYGGEMSAHHYFRDFGYCDSGMIPWLLVLELLSISGLPLSELIKQRQLKYPCSGEINFVVNDPKLTMESIQQKFSKYRPIVDETDGVSMEFDEWRFNLRASNTEALLRLNVETRQNRDLLSKKTRLLSDLIIAS